MKTLEEIKEHLSEVGYNKQAMLQIEAFLLGGGMITQNEELDFIKGKGDFEDFMEWYTTDENWEFEKGAYIHVEDGMDVLVISNVYDGKFIGTNGKNIHQYEVTKETRPCLDKEIEKINTTLCKNGVMYFPYCDEFEPFKSVNELSEEEKDELLLENIVKVNSEQIDKLEIKCHEAIDNLAAALHSRETDIQEFNALVGSLKSLIELGKLYE